MLYHVAMDTYDWSYEREEEAEKEKRQKRMESRTGGFIAGKAGMILLRRSEKHEKPKFISHHI